MVESDEESDGSDGPLTSPYTVSSAPAPDDLTPEQLGFESEEEDQEHLLYVTPLSLCSYQSSLTQLAL